MTNMSRTKEQRMKYGRYLKDKTYEEVFGIEKAREIKAKMSKVKTGNKYPKISKTNKGRIGYFKGHTHSKESKDKIGIAFKGKKLSEEHKRHIKENTPRGEKHPFWQGGISFEPYGVEFNGTLKKQIRERDGYVCQLTGQYGNIVHHIDYNKRNNYPSNLITLSRSSNVKVNSNRDYWKKYFINLIKNHGIKSIS